MEQYIPKSALIAELERMKSVQLSIFNKGVNEKDCYDALTCISVYNEILSFISNLEVKDVDLDGERRKYLTEHFNVYEDGILQSKRSNLPLDTYDVIKIAKHFFELGIKAQKGE